MNCDAGALQGHHLQLYLDKSTVILIKVDWLSYQSSASVSWQKVKFCDKSQISQLNCLGFYWTCLKRKKNYFSFTFPSRWPQSFSQIPISSGWSSGYAAE